LFDLFPVGIENAITEIDTRRRRRLGDQDLVAAHAKMAVGNAAHAPGIKPDLLADCVEDDEIVSQGLHFGESEHRPEAYSHAAAAQYLKCGTTYSAILTAFATTRTTGCARPWVSA